MNSNHHVEQDWGPEGHPSLEVLRRYQSERLTPEQTHQVERHLVSCELCSDLVEGMQMAQATKVYTAVKETRGRVKNYLAKKKRKPKFFVWSAWQTAAILLILLFCLALMVYHFYFAPTAPGKQNSPQKPQTSVVQTASPASTIPPARQG
jgi:anti-sigma factor RsiW